MEKEELIKKIMNCCFADDSVNPKGGKFWENFANLNVDDVESNNFSIYYNKNNPDERSLPDPDAYSEKLYKFHKFLWNKREQRSVEVKWKNYIPAYELNDETFRLGSDSIINIYWHRTSVDMPDKNIKNNRSALEGKIGELENSKDDRENKRFYSEHYSLYKEFIWHYLQYANTIGGFVVFPRHENPTINTKRGFGKIGDRFDLTLECIKRYYKDKERSKTNYNPVFSTLNNEHIEEDKYFFGMFKTFENYAKFFCLSGERNWVNENGQVLNLFDNTSLDNYDFSQEPLPTKADQWWTFYDNIMKRLDARNKQIEKLLMDECNENELRELDRELYGSLNSD